MAHKLDITVLTGVSQGDVFHYSLEPGGEIIVGRSEECDLVLQDPSVSRRHARIFLNDSGFQIEDLGSTHGTIHMGFQLQGGNKRTLHDEDEFRVGEALFRAGFDESPFKKKEAPKSEETTGVGTKKKKVAKKKLIIALLSLVLVGAVAMMLMPSGGGGPVAQKSSIIMSMPQEVVIGNFSEGKGAGKSDRSHLDMAQFHLPASDVIVEFDFLSEAPVHVFVDDARIAELQPFTAGWERHAILSRDIMGGFDRKFVLDNTDYPKKTPGKNKLWAVKNVRATPLNRPIDTQFEALLAETVGAVEALTQSSAGVFNALRKVQRCILEALREGNQDAYHYSISADSPPPNPEELRQLVEVVLNERRATHDIASVNEHLNKLGRVASSLEGELLRSFNYAMFTVPRLVKSKNYVEAFDILIELQSKVPDESDLRWITAERMIKDKKVIPPKVRANPGKFRKKAN